jgi:integrase/recombinase XerD
MKSLGQLLHSFFEDYLKVQKGLRPSSVKSYRDTLKLFITFVATTRRRPVTRLAVADLNSDRVLEFLSMVEVKRANHARTRNQRLAALHTFYRYVATAEPEMLAQAERVEAIPSKRTQAPETRYLEPDEIDAVFTALPRQGSLALRDRALLMFLYNTGARAQEAADLRVGDVDLDGPLRVRLHGKGDKWRACPIWPETAVLLKQLESVEQGDPEQALFTSRRRQALTRFGIYKIVRRHTRMLRPKRFHSQRYGISPHVFPTTSRAASPPPATTSPNSTRPTATWPPITARRFSPPGPVARKTRPRPRPAVLLVERWVLARLRHQRFFSLG